MTKCKIVQKSDANKASLGLELPHSKKDHDNFLKNYKPTITTLNFNDFNPESDEYEVTEVSVNKSSVKIKFTEAKGKMIAVLESADIELSFDDGDQEERFLDKDWSEEWVEPTICFKGSKAGDEIYLPYEDNSLFTIDL